MTAMLTPDVALLQVLQCFCIDLVRGPAMPFEKCVKFCAT